MNLMFQLPDEIERDQLSDNYIKIWEFYATLADNNYDMVLNHLDVYNEESRMIIELAFPSISRYINRST